MNRYLRIAFACLFILSMWGNSIYSQEFQITDFPATYFTYDKFNNGMFIKGSPLGKSGFIYFDLKSNETVYTFTHGNSDLPAMYNNSAKCIYNSQEDGFIRFRLFDISTGEDRIIFQIPIPDPTNEKISVSESPFTISPDDKYLFYITGWFFHIEDSTIIHSNPEFYMCGRDEPHSWKNDTTIIYASCGGTVSEYDLETVEINQIFDFPLDPEDEILTLDYNPVFDVIAFSVGRETLPPKVYLYDYKDDKFRMIYELEITIKDEILELAWSPDNLLLAFSWFADVDNSPDLMVYNIVLDSVTTYRDVTDEPYDLEWISDDTLAYFSNFRIRGYSFIDTTTSVANEDVSYENQMIKVSVYPNPFNDQVHIKISSQLLEPLIMNIYDIKGQLILSKTFNSNKKEYNHFWTGENNEGVKVGSGIYLLRISSSNNLYRSITKKLLLLK